MKIINIQYNRRIKKPSDTISKVDNFVADLRKVGLLLRDDRR